MEISRAKRIRTNSPTVISFEVSESLTPELRDLFQKGIEKAGDVYTLEIGPFKKTRTTGPYSQNKHLNGHINQLAAAEHMSETIMKKYIKVLAAAEMNYPTESYRGIIEPISESKASTVECGYLIDMCHIHASRLGLSLYEGEGWIN